MRVAVFDTKPYDLSMLLQAGAGKLEWEFIEARLGAQTAGLAQGCAAACIFVNDRADAKALAKLKQAGVGCLALRCAGYSHVDLAAAGRLGIKACRVPAYSPYAVAEHTLALLLSLNRKIHRAHLRVREHDFRLQGLLGWDLHSRTVGVVGTGRIGQLVAQAFRGFGCAVLAHDPKPAPAWARRHGVAYKSLAGLLKASDIVTLHLPLSPATRHLINAKSLALMKPGAYLINTSRGALLDTAAIIQVLKQGRLGGVALDVYEEEEGVFFEDRSADVIDDALARLLSFPNILVTSHQGYFTQEALAEIGRVSAENLRRFQEGKPFLKGTALSA
jgi:D-lactate dehydrogenase